MPRTTPSPGYDQMIITPIVVTLIGIGSYFCKRYWEKLPNVTFYETAGIIVCLCVICLLILYLPLLLHGVFSNRGYTAIAIILILAIGLLGGLLAAWKMEPSKDIESLPELDLPEQNEGKLEETIAKLGKVVKDLISRVTGDRGSMAYQGRTLHYEVKGGLHGHGIKKKYQHAGKAWDDGSGISVKSKGWKSAGGARKHVLADLIVKLKQEGLLKEEL